MPLCSTVRLLGPLLLFLSILEETSQQEYVLLHRHNIPYIWTLLWRGKALSYNVVCVLHNTFREKNCCSIRNETINTVTRSQHLSLRSSFRSDTSCFSSRARYCESLSISNTSNLFTAQNLVKELQYSYEISNFVYSGIKNPTMIGSLCSICALASSNSYNELFTWSGFLNSLHSIAACIFLSLSYFVTVCRLRSMTWWL